MIQCQLKLKLRPTQERQLNRWLWHLTGVHNWAVTKIGRDAKDGIYWDRRAFRALVNGHSIRLGIPTCALRGSIDTAFVAWDRTFKGLSRRPRLKGRRNALNSVLFDSGPNWVRDRKASLPGIGVVRFHRQAIPAGRVGYARAVRRASGWYLCLVVQSDRGPIAPVLNGQIGIDPGFSKLLTTSDAEVVEHPHELRAGATRLAQAQRGRRRQLTARLLQRQADRRKDRNHKLSLRLVRENQLIVWSKDRTNAIAQSFGKSVASAAHSQLRAMLAYKSRAGGREFIEVDSRNSTRTCSACGALTGPAGYAGLSVRQWTCGACGAPHERDVNAARNTLLAGLGTSHERRRETASGIVTSAKRRSSQRKGRDSKK